MNNEQLEKIKHGDGFIAALDQSGGSTPKALKLYGINEDEYSGEDEMFDRVHEMRKRIIKSPSFTPYLYSNGWQDGQTYDLSTISRTRALEAGGNSLATNALPSASPSASSH